MSDGERIETVTVRVVVPELDEGILGIISSDEVLRHCIHDDWMPSEEREDALRDGSDGSFESVVVLRSHYELLLQKLKAATAVLQHLPQIDVDQWWHAEAVGEALDYTRGHRDFDDFDHLVEMIKAERRER